MWPWSIPVVLQLERFRSLMENDAFTPVVDSMHHCTRSSEAFDRQQQRGKRGKILIDFDGPH